MSAITNFFDMVPDQNNTLLLGYADTRFKNLYAQTIDIIDPPTISSLTAGRLIFPDASSVLTQDGKLFWRNDDKQLQIGDAVAVTGLGFNNIPLTVGGNFEPYLGLQIQNLSTGIGSSCDYLASADNDTTSLVGHYIDLGIWSSGFDGSSTGFVLTFSISAGGFNYVVGDVLRLVAGDSNATIQVLTVVDGAVDTAEIINNGSGYSVANGIETTLQSIGVGSDCVVDILTLLDFSLYSANDGYVYITGGDLVLGTLDPTYIMKFHTGGTGVTNERLRIEDTKITSQVPIIVPSLKILESGTTPTKYTIFQGGDQSVDLTYTLPTAYPAISGYVLSATDAGVMSWAAGGGVTEETPTGSVDGSNTSFTVAHTPKFVIIDGMFRVSGQGYTYSSPTITVDSLIPPINFIRSFFSSGGITEETPTGTVNGVNTTFTVSNTPKFVIIDGMFRVNGQGYTYSSPTITVDSLIPPVDFIRNFY